MNGQIKDADVCNRHEAKVLWNTGNSTEAGCAAFHQIPEAIESKDLAAITADVSAAYHFNKSTHERAQERVDFFTDSLESGNSEVTLLQKRVCVVFLAKILLKKNSFRLAGLV